MGIDGAKAMGFERVKLRQQFVINPPNFSTYDQVLMIDFQDDERDLAGDAYDLFQLKKTFKQAINFPENFNRVQYRIQQAIRTATPENFSRLKNFVTGKFNAILRC